MRWRISGLLAMGVALAAHAGNWPVWRGPTGDGLSPEASGWPSGWPPERRWSATVGAGCTSPVLLDGTLYVLGWSGPSDRLRDNPPGTETLFAFDARTGRELWRQESPGRYQGRLRVGDTDAYGGPSATPTADAASGRLFMLSPDGDLRAWNLRAKGALLWQVNLYETCRTERRPDVGGGQRDFGFTGAPRLWNGLLLVEVGAPEGFVAAFDPATGQRRWLSEPGNEASGHTGGLVVLPGPAGDRLAVLSLAHLLVLELPEPRAGRTLARLPWATEFGCNIPTPAVAGSRLFVTSGYNQRRTAAFDVGVDGALALRWESRVHAVVSSPVVKDDRVYVLGGSLACLDAATGATRWRGGQFGNGSMIATADGKLIVHGEGRLALVDAAPETTAYRELSRLDRVLPATAYPHIALSDGLLVCKDRAGNLTVFSVVPRAAAPTSPAGPGSATTAAPTGPPGVDFAWRAGDVSAELQPHGAAALGPQGRLELSGGSFELPRLAGPLLNACRSSGTLSFEVEFTPTDTRQEGPARILSFSSDPYHRNFTLGQERDRVVLRLRTPETGENGMNPETTLGTLAAGRKHHVAVAYADGRLTARIDGLATVDTDAVRGDFSNWELQTLRIGNEATGDRSWRGSVHALRITGGAVPAARQGPDSAAAAAPSAVATAAPVSEAAPPTSQPSALPPGVTLGTDERGRPTLTIATPKARFVYDLRGGGLASLFDPEGRDWSGHGATAGARGRYRGVPNLVHPDGGFHPGDDRCVSHVGPVKDGVLAVRSETVDGRWICRWSFFDGYAVMDLECAGGAYWFLYEGTPGGDYDEDRTWMMDSARTRMRAADRWERRLPEPRWLAFGCDGVDRALFVADLTVRAPDVTDSFWSMERSMTVFGFGRSLQQGSRWLHLREVPARFVVGFASAASDEALAAHLAQLLLTVAPAASP